MKKIFERIKEIAAPYQDKRGDPGHAAITLDYVRQLTELEKGDEDVTIPAMILHDIGWSQVKPEYVDSVFKSKGPREGAWAVVTQHQNESVRLAADILHSIDYSENLTKEILQIILQHDTRMGFISKNEGLVRDADKLYRFSRAGFANDIRRSGATAEEECKRLEAELKNPKYIYSKSAVKIASQELALRKASLT